MKLFLFAKWLSRNIFLTFFLAFSLLSGAASAQGRDDTPVWRYTVKPGDNLITIAERYFLRADQWTKVQKDNRIEDPHRILPGTVLRIPASMLRKAPGQVVVESIHGQVRWRSGEMGWQDAAAGQKLSVGDSLETQEDSSALLSLSDGSRIKVAQNSQLSLDTLSLYAGGLMADTRLCLRQGQTTIQANPARRDNQHLRIQTPSAQAVVRGTHFNVNAEESVTREETLDGKVGVRGTGRHAEKEIAIAKGLGSVTRAGEAPSQPIPLLAAANVVGLPARIEQLPMRFPMPELAGAEAWRGELAPVQSPEHVLLAKSTQSDALSFSDLPNGDYILTLYALDANGLRGQPATHPFTVFARPFPPILNVPADSAVIRTLRPEFSWGNMVDTTRYHIQVSASPDFSPMLYDETLALEKWVVPAELPPGQLYWRAASLTDDGQQGPWNTAAFTYRPGPGEVELRKTALQVESDKLVMMLTPPPEGLFYEALLSSEKHMEPVLSRASSGDGRLELPRPASGVYYLGIRLVDRSDNTPGPIAARKVEIPPSRLWLMLLLLPLAL